MQRQSEDVASVYGASMTSDMMNSSFATNDERLRRPSIIANKDSMQATTMKVNKKYAHIKSKIAPIIHRNLASQKPRQSKVDTPVANKESADEYSTKNQRMNAESNSFSMAEDLTDQQVEAKELNSNNLGTTDLD